MAKQNSDWKSKFKAIRNVLNTEWDPIGCGVPDDEYDSYVPVIYRLMQGQAGIVGLAFHLEELETLSMGLTANPERNRRVAEMLLELME